MQHWSWTTTFVFVTFNHITRTLSENLPWLYTIFTLYDCQLPMSGSSCLNFQFCGKRVLGDYRQQISPVIQLSGTTAAIVSSPSLSINSTSMYIYKSSKQNVKKHIIIDVYNSLCSLLMETYKQQHVNHVVLKYTGRWIENWFSVMPSQPQ